MWPKKQRLKYTLSRRYSHLRIHRLLESRLQNPCIKSSRIQDPFDIAFENEIRLGKEIVDAANACLGTLEHFAISSLPDAVEISKGLHPLLKHCISKATTVEYIICPATLADDRRSVWSITSESWPGYYMEN